MRGGPPDPASPSPARNAVQRRAKKRGEPLVPISVGPHAPLPAPAASGLLRARRKKSPLFPSPEPRLLSASPGEGSRCRRCERALGAGATAALPGPPPPLSRPEAKPRRPRAAHPPALTLNAGPRPRLALPGREVPGGRCSAAGSGGEGEGKEETPQVWLFRGRSHGGGEGEGFLPPPPPPRLSTAWLLRVGKRKNSAEGKKKKVRKVGQIGRKRGKRKKEKEKRFRTSLRCGLSSSASAPQGPRAGPPQRHRARRPPRPCLHRPRAARGLGLCGALRTFRRLKMCAVVSVCRMKRSETSEKRESSQKNSGDKTIRTLCVVCSYCR